MAPPRPSPVDTKPARHLLSSQPFSTAGLLVVIEYIHRRHDEISSNNTTLLFPTVRSWSPCDPLPKQGRPSRRSSLRFTHSACAILCVRQYAHVKQFDERSTQPILPLPNPVGTEKGLLFKSFVLVNSALAGVGINLQSPPIEITTAKEQQVVDGTPTITVTGNTRAFDLESFYFGCAVNSVEGAEAVPKRCTILVAGFKGKQERVDATYTYTPTAKGGRLQPQIQAVLPSRFVGLQNVTIIQDDPTLEALVMDSISVILCQ
ncbi:hypothetical protein G7Y79_00038g074510 [Physcia stellaris]|nr:hypothetical protein G7Y79_00038g074510 [Physcia stellaris]